MIPTGVLVLARVYFYFFTVWTVIMAVATHTWWMLALPVGLVAVVAGFARPAKLRARRRLAKSLTLGQRLRWWLLGYFYVISSSGKRWQVNATGPSILRQKTYYTSDGKRRTMNFRQRYCIHTDKLSIPVEDGMLGIALLLRTNEERFLRIANPH